MNLHILLLQMSHNLHDFISLHAKFLVVNVLC